jgi:hypothetical protein
MKVKILSAETDLSANTTVFNAVVVRVYNSDTADILVENNNGTSFTMPPGAISYIVKESTETLVANSSILACSIAYT